MTLHFWASRTLTANNCTILSNKLPNLKTLRIFLSDICANVFLESAYMGDYGISEMYMYMYVGKGSGCAWASPPAVNDARVRLFVSVVGTIGNSVTNLRHFQENLFILQQITVSGFVQEASEVICNIRHTYTITVHVNMDCILNSMTKIMMAISKEANKIRKPNLVHNTARSGLLAQRNSDVVDCRRSFGCLESLPMNRHRHSNSVSNKACVQNPTGARKVQS